MKKKKQEINLKPEFPSNSRSIPESVFAFVREEKYVLLASLSGAFFFCLMLYMIVQLSISLQVQKRADGERARVTQEMVFWQGVVADRPEYRDGYFMLAVLAYRLGKKQEARVNVEKVLEIDPNFKEGRELEKILATSH